LKAEGLYYLKLDFDFFEVNLKTKALIKSYGLAGSAFYLYIAIKLYKANECRLEYGDFIFDALAFDNFDTSEKVKQFIDDCIHKFKLFKRDGDYFHCPHVDEAVEKYENSKALFSESGKLGAKRRWGKAEPEKPASSLTFNDYKEKLKDKYPGVDVDNEWEQCQIWYRDHKKKIKSPSLALYNWCKKESSIGTPRKDTPKSSKRFDPSQPLR